MCVCLVSQSYPTRCCPLDCSPPGSSVHGILQTRILDWVAIPFSRGSSWPRDQTRLSCIAGRLFAIWATKKPIQFSRSVLSDCLQPHGLQHARPPCPLPTPGVYSNSCPLSWWCHSVISSSVVPFSSTFNLSHHQGIFSSESVLPIRWPKYWSFSFNISPSNEHSGLTSFMMDWLDLLIVQGTLKSLLQCHSSKAAILWHSAYSHPSIHTYIHLTSIHDYWKNRSPLLWVSLPK